MHLGRHCAEVRKAPTRREICKAGDGNNSLCRQLHADFPGRRGMKSCVQAPCRCHRADRPRGAGAGQGCKGQRAQSFACRCCTRRHGRVFGTAVTNDQSGQSCTLMDSSARSAGTSSKVTVSLQKGLARSSLSMLVDLLAVPTSK